MNDNNKYIEAHAIESSCYYILPDATEKSNQQLENGNYEFNIKTARDSSTSGTIKVI